MRINDNKSKIASFVMLHAILLMYSFCSVFSTLAAGAEFMSFQFILCYGLMMIVLAAYALLWQQVLKRMPLTTAFANKAVTVVWGIIWGFLFFHESITVGKVLGALFVIMGVVLYSYADREDDYDKN